MAFGDQIRDAREEIITDVDDYRKAVTIKLFNSVIDDTPVDTGRLRGNWQTNEGSAKKGEVDRNNGGEAKDEVVSVTEASKPDTVVHLTNNLPYSNRVEFGRTGGMMRKNLARIQQILRGRK